MTNPASMCVFWGGWSSVSRVRWHIAWVAAILRKFRVNWHLWISGCLFWKVEGTLVLEDIWPSGQLPSKTDQGGQEVREITHTHVSHGSCLCSLFCLVYDRSETFHSQNFKAVFLPSLHEQLNSELVAALWGSLPLTILLDSERSCEMFRPNLLVSAGGRITPPPHPPHPMLLENNI